MINQSNCTAPRVSLFSATCIVLVSFAASIFYVIFDQPSNDIDDSPSFDSLRPGADITVSPQSRSSDTSIPDAKQLQLNDSDHVDNTHRKSSGATLEEDEQHNNYEKKFITDEGKLDVAAARSLAVEENFREFQARLRADYSPAGEKIKIGFQDRMMLHPDILNGSITLEELECGAVFCLARYSGYESDLLVNFVFDITGKYQVASNWTSISIIPDNNSETDRIFLFSYVEKIVGLSESGL